MPLGKSAKQPTTFAFLSKEQDIRIRNAEDDTISAIARVYRPVWVGRSIRSAAISLVLVWIGLHSSPALAAQTDDETAFAALPDAPDPQTSAASPVPKVKPCPAGEKPLRLTSANDRGSDPPSITPVPSPPPCRKTWASRYQYFVNGPQDKPLTPKDKAWLAARNMVDPFNTITILGEAAISVGSDSHSPYGPGMPGYARYVGVSFTQELTGEFFGTFLIPSLVHQDPHYHRMPTAKIPRRIAHATFQVVWTQGDNGTGMLNYANLVGFAIDDEISNLYVPGRETSVSASFSRYAIGMASAPIGNFITEFLPDVARHIHVQVVIIQRIINQVARSEGGQP